MKISKIIRNFYIYSFVIPKIKMDFVSGLITLEERDKMIQKMWDLLSEEEEDEE
jgi:hypothetical protein